ncbi:MAG: hypothetical protein EZS26_000967 [Candidatus Ordinivivax streblomastigis]|uniref:Uncharacterized protein n=1 Tax=Candidatus Ordinivivax streblomastigis TaxID=2540710 RepID=A0A5M8P2U2_9BACT|nr:MAG: hypothetical protein EZS26_000967 [Candidatus Ordinivivax streblomastigis]
MINDAKLPKVQIMLELSIKYNTSRSSIEAIIYDKVNNKSRHCSHCGVELSKYKYTKNGGLCEKCLANKE